MKTVLAVWHSGNKGKTETLREFANLLISTYPRFRPIFPTPTTIPATGDFRLVIEIEGKIIGVESQGDPKTKLKERLLKLADEFKCDIIVCTSRTRGETVKAVDNLFHTRSFQTIWTSTYQIAGRDNQRLVNQLKAKHILELLQRLAII